MITIKLGIILGIAFAIYKGYKEGHNDFVLYLLESLLCSVVGVLISGIIAFSLPMKTNIYTYTVNIESLQDSNGVVGSFFLGSGTIGNEMCYIFYQENNGYYQLTKINSRYASIKYSSEKPKITVYEQKPTDDLINIFALDILSEKEYIIEVPKGTILNNYKLDAN